MIQNIIPINNTNSSGFEMTLLWENASPDSTFEPQTLNIDLTGYDLFAVHAGNTTIHPDAFVFGRVGSMINALQTNAITSGTAYSGLQTRWFDNQAIKSITVTKCIANGIASCTAFNENNNILKPYRIYGIKGVKTA